MNRHLLAGLFAVGMCLALWLLLGPVAPRVDQSSQPNSDGSAIPRSSPGTATNGFTQASRAKETPSTIASAAREPAPSQNPGAITSPQENKPEIEPSTVAEHARAIITQYNSMFGENPVGTNKEITLALQGKNPKQINFLGDVAAQINSNQEWVDPWGTPYFFHQLSASQMEVRSAGPDKTLWTADDVVAR